MGMPAAIEVVGGHEVLSAINAAFAYLDAVDVRFSTYKAESEISKINRGEIPEAQYSDEMREVLALAEKTKRETHGYFDIRTPQGALDPSGIVKGWAIRTVARMIAGRGFGNYMVEIGGDIQSHGLNEKGEVWTVGIRNPLDAAQVVKVLYPHGSGIATSGTAARGDHIYNPHEAHWIARDLLSITVVGPDVCEADRFATAAFVMGAEGAPFIERLPGFEAYAIRRTGLATMTSGLARYLSPTLLDS